MFRGWDKTNDVHNPWKWVHLNLHLRCIVGTSAIMLSARDTTPLACHWVRVMSHTGLTQTQSGVGGCKITEQGTAVCYVNANATRRTKTCQTSL